MKRLILGAVTYIGIFISLLCATSVDISMGGPALVASSYADAVTISCTQVVPKGTQAHQKRECMRNHGLVKLQECEQTQVRTVPSDILVQAMGRICITPGGQCDLPEPAPINSSCCCPNGQCGYVAP